MKKQLEILARLEARADKAAAAPAGLRKLAEIRKIFVELKAFSYTLNPLKNETLR